MIAHCGIFGCGGDEIAAEGIPTLKADPRPARQRPRRHLRSEPAPCSSDAAALDHERIVFGSDALYFSMWRAVVTLLHALRTAGFPLEDSFARIAAHNARTRLRLGTGGRSAPPPGAVNGPSPRCRGVRTRWAPRDPSSVGPAIHFREHLDSISPPPNFSFRQSTAKSMERPGRCGRNQRIRLAARREVSRGIQINLCVALNPV